MMTDDIARALALSIDRRIPFVCYSMPMEEDTVYFADPDADCYYADDALTGTGLKVFVAADFNKTFYPPLAIRPMMDATSVVASAQTETVSGIIQRPYDVTTTREDYLSGVGAVIDRLKRDGGKTVISRVMCESCGGYDWVAVVDEYFGMFPSCFRYCFYHPLSGFWIGATPELLLDCNLPTGCFSTMSLAGTRPVTDHELPWDDKNVREHDMVTRYISDTLDDLGIRHEVSDATSLRYGTVEHLCHHITGHLDGVSPLALVNRLSPTPALAGYPLEAALEDIAAVERHPRHMYGGYVGIISDDRLRTFVNIRCANFGSDSVCVYGGGGITAQSSPADEWAEAEAKMKPLVNVLARHRQ
ncbi:MAG: chorismate-binding protein [Pseudoflavonifractor sp.]|nr:chorismate-binding protein [Pseudoflavonifractor sp.]